MKKRLLLVLGLVAASPLRAQEPSFAERMQLAYEQSRDPGLLLIIAEGYAREGKRDEALRWVKPMVAEGHDLDVPRTSALGRFADDPAFASLFAQLEQRSGVVAPGARKIVLPAVATEGIAADPRDGALFVGDITHRRILRVTKDGKVRPFGPRLKLPPLGIAVDPARDTLWIATSGAVAVPEQQATSLVRCRIRTGACITVAGTAGSLNDIAIARDGTAYISDSMLGRVWRVSPTGARLQSWSGGENLNFANGLTFSASGRHLYVAQGLAPMAIELSSGKRTSLSTGGKPSLIGIDGLYRSGSTLIGIQNAIHQGRLIAIDLAADETSVTAVRTLANRAPEFAEPTTAAIDRGRLFLIGNSQISPRAREGTLQPLTILEYQLADLLGTTRSPVSGGGSGDAASPFFERPMSYAASAPGISVVKDAYRHDGTAADLYLPRQAPAGLVIIIPGSAPGAPDPRGWKSLRDWAKTLAAAGLQVALPRFADAEPEALAAIRRRQVLELAAALRQQPRVRGHDVCVLAMSAGGAPLLDLGRDRAIACRVGLYPVLSLAPKAPEAGEPVSPLLIVRAGADQVPGARSSVDNFLPQALAADQAIELVNVPEAAHGFDIERPTDRGEAAVRRIVQFLQTELLRREAQPQAARRR